MKIAVIDLGTNTFNLLIAEIQNNNYTILSNTRESVKIGKGGIHKDIIQPEAIGRAIFALEKHFENINREKVDEIYTIGTSALRTAANGLEFKKIVKEKFGVEIEIISGEREAELIYLGVRMSLENLEKPFLILDIGGGSNEFIISKNNSIVWKHSFPLGMARLIEKFHPSDPIKKQEIEEMEVYFDQVLQSLYAAVKACPVDYLVGAEGAFESFYNSIQYRKKTNYSPSLFTKARPIEKEDFIDFHNDLIRTSLNERALVRGIEPYRLDMVVPSVVFVNYVINRLNINRMLVSGFSLKEGVLYERLKR